MHLFKNCQIQFLILYELIVWACFIWVNKLHRAADRWRDRALICRLVVTAQETWFTLHNISRLLFQAAGRQFLFFFFFFYFSFFLHTCLFRDSWKSFAGSDKREREGEKKNTQTHCTNFAPVCASLPTDCRNRCQVMFSQLESVESVMRKCMNVNMIP